MKLRYVLRKHVSHVELQKDGTTSIGIVVKAYGTMNGLRPCINSIKRGSIAYKSHCVAEGDVVVSVCGRDAKGMSKKEFKRFLNEARSKVDLKLEYEIKDACFSKGGIYRKDQMMVMLKKDLHSYGFVLRKNDLPHSGYPVVTNIREGGPADRDSRLKSGDRVLQIDELNLKWLSLSEVADILSERDEIKMVIEYTIALVENTQVRKGRGPT
ncbi:glutamate receptor-interacting protein 1 [Caerostris darwini]|uniref:Glutamate receptor-interacting protein 1 n=1 Tax=Caerostris darwini TaxID=1538125 RepID=A0AAV4R1P2_9ARAC|nr:glutamate receptor-interacting protein 1 [Caerostris darwini]